MLRAERTDVRPHRYALTHDGRELATLTLDRRGSGGGFDLDGASYRIRSHSFRDSYDLVAEDLSLVATAEGVRRREWTVQTEEQTHRFRRSLFRGRRREESLLDVAGEPVGSLTRTGWCGTGADADLPGVDPRVQVLAIAVALQRWRRRRRRGAAVIGAAGG